MSLLRSLSIWTLNLRTSAEWIDDLADVLLFGKCHHVDLVVPHGESGEFLEFANWLRGQGPWTLAVRERHVVQEGQFVYLAHRGPSLLHWFDWVEVVHMERTGEPFDDSEMEA